MHSDIISIFGVILVLTQAEDRRYLVHVRLPEDRLCPSYVGDRSVGFWIFLRRDSAPLVSWHLRASRSDCPRARCW